MDKSFLKAFLRFLLDQNIVEYEDYEALILAIEQGTPLDASKMWTRQDLADYLSVSLYHVDWLCDQGVFKKYKIGKRVVRLFPVQVIDAIESGKLEEQINASRKSSLSKEKLERVIKAIKKKDGK